MAYTAPRTWVTGELVTAALLNTHVRDNLNAAFPLGVDAWTSYTPTLTQSTTLTKTVTYARYQRIGRTIHMAVDLAITSAGVSGNNIVLGLPLTASVVTGVVGVFRYFDAGNTIYTGTALGASTTTVVFYVSSNGNAMGVNPTFAAASGDSLQCQITYEALS